MKYTNIIEKFTCLLELIQSSIVYPIFLGIIAIITVLLLFKKINKKLGLITISISYLTLLIITISNNFIGFSNLFDNLATNFFTNIYFPSAYTYLFILTIMDITMIKSVLNKDEELAYKITNSVSFYLMQFIFILIINTVVTNKIDIFTKKSLFSNTTLVILLESSMNIFLAWLLTRSIIYTTDKIVENISLNKMQKNIQEANILTFDATQFENDNNYQEEYIYANKVEEPKKEEYINRIEDNFTLNDLIFKEENTITEDKKASEELFNKLINNEIPLIHEEEIEEEKNTYTLNDYKIFNKILKEIRETNNSNIINLDKELENKLSYKYNEEELNLFKLMLKNYSN